MANLLAKVFFNFVLVACTLIPLILAKAGLCLTSCCKNPGRRILSMVFNPLLAVMWRLVFCVCCWIRFDCDGIAEFKKAMKGKKPRIVLQNHISFLDAIIAATCCPISSTANLKSLASEHLFKMPALGDLMVAWGHLSVPFKSQVTKKADSVSKDGDVIAKAVSVADFSVDKDAIAKVMKDFEDHVANGGIGGWYPEGRMNPDPSELQTFRAGGFGVATDIDCEVWCMVTRGNDLCWPRKAAVGGEPCRIGIKFFKLCDSSFQYFKEANIDDSDGKKHQKLYMANTAQRLMQIEYDSMAGSGSASRLL